MKTVPLCGKKAAGRVAFVDDADHDLAMQYRWYLWEKKSSSPRRRDQGPYAIRVVYDEDGQRIRPVSMHSLITGWDRVDHIDHDGLNNQRHNLRQADDSQNAANMRPQLGGTSAYKGVSWWAARNRWQATIHIDGRQRHLGCFAQEEHAARAYDRAALAAWGEYACLNFPQRTPRRVTSRYRGVYLHQPGQWRAQIKVNRKESHLGLFTSEEAAARAYDAAALAARGESAKLNFPEA